MYICTFPTYVLDTVIQSKWTTLSEWPGTPEEITGQAPTVVIHQKELTKSKSDNRSKRSPFTCHREIHKCKHSHGKSGTGIHANRYWHHIETDLTRDDSLRYWTRNPRSSWSQRHNPPCSHTPVLHYISCSRTREFHLISCSHQQDAFTSTVAPLCIVFTVSEVPIPVSCL